MAVYYAAITSEGRGRVVAVPGWRDPVVTYQLTSRDRALLGRGLARLALVMLEAGATAVYPSFRGAPVVRTPRSRHDAGNVQRRAGQRDDGAPVLDGADGRGHPTCRRPTATGRVNGTTNVYVNDASLLPDAPGVNPQASVMAIAIRNVRRFIENPTFVATSAGDDRSSPEPADGSGRALLAALTDPPDRIPVRSIRALVTSAAEALNSPDCRASIPSIGDVRTAAGLDALFGGLPAAQRST